MIDILIGYCFGVTTVLFFIVMKMCDVLFVKPKAVREAEKEAQAPGEEEEDKAKDINAGFENLMTYGVPGLFGGE